MARPEHEVLEVNAWATEIEDGVYQFNSPITGEALVTRDAEDNLTPPSFLLQDPDLDEGYYAAKSNAEYWGTNVLYSLGENTTEGVEGTLGAIVRDHRVHILGHTVDGTRRDEDGVLFIPERNATPYTRLIDELAPFETRQICVGLAEDINGRPAGRAERALAAISAEAERYSKSSEAGEVGLWAAGLIKDYMTQWYHALQVGEQVMKVVGTSVGEMHYTDQLTIAVVAPVMGAHFTNKLVSLGFCGLDSDRLRRNFTRPGEFMMFPDLSEEFEAELMQEVELRHDVMNAGVFRG